jgi:hypothetical protein
MAVHSIAAHDLPLAAEGAAVMGEWTRACRRDATSLLSATKYQDIKVYAGSVSGWPVNLAASLTTMGASIGAR